jgi:hypothetical protein
MYQQENSSGASLMQLQQLPQLLCVLLLHIMCALLSASLYTCRALVYACLQLRSVQSCA